MTSEPHPLLGTKFAATCTGAMALAAVVQALTGVIGFLPSCATSNSTTPPAQSTPAQAERTPGEPELTRELDGLRIAVVRASRQGSDVVVDLEFTSLDRDADIRFYANNPRVSRVIAADGNSYKPKTSTIGSSTEGGWSWATLVAGLPTSGRLVYPGIPSDVATLARLDLTGVHGPEGSRDLADWSVEMQNIPIE